MRFFALAATLAASGCGGSASVKPAGPPPCETRVVATHPADTVTVVVFDKIDLSHAPWPRNREERFVFSHLYETLVKVDCRGMVQPGLAKSWKKASDGWYIELQEDAHFWDDTMVTAEDVKESFGPAIRKGIAIASVDEVDETHLIVHWREHPFDVELLALPILAITKEPQLPGPPIGTGPWQMDAGARPAANLAIRPTATATPVVSFLQRDPTRALDVAQTADAIITDDPTVIDYMETRSKAMMTPLPWDAAYVVVSRSRTGGRCGGKACPGLPSSACQSLARDAVRVDARGGSSIVTQSENLSSSGVVNENFDPPYQFLQEPQQLIYDAGDKTARDLAERVVSVASMDTTRSETTRALRAALPGVSSRMRARGLEKSEFAQQLARGSDFAYLVRLSWNADYPFLDTLSPDRVAWLFDGWPLSGATLPLVETRPHFIAMTDRIGFTHDEAGNVRLIPPGVERVR